MADAARAMVSIDRRYLAAVLALVALDRVIMIYRWVLLLRASGVPITTAKAADIFLVSSFVGSFLPAGVGADAARAYSLRNHILEGGEALASVVVDRLLGTLSLGVMALGGAVGVVLGRRPATGGCSWPSRCWPRSASERSGPTISSKSCWRSAFTPGAPGGPCCA